MTKRFNAIVLVAAAILLPAQVAPGAEEADRPDGEQAPVPPPCSACMQHFPQSCESRANATVVALVEGTHRVAADTECEPLIHPNYASWCFSSVAYEFRSIRFLRNDARALPENRFVSNFRYKHNRPNAAKEGVALEEGESYVIFAGPAIADSQPPAQWFITTACKVGRQ